MKLFNSTPSAFSTTSEQSEKINKRLVGLEDNLTIAAFTSAQMFRYHRAICLNTSIKA